MHAHDLAVRLQLDLEIRPRVAGDRLPVDGVGPNGRRDPGLVAAVELARRGTALGGGAGLSGLAQQPADRGRAALGSSLLFGGPLLGLRLLRGELSLGFLLLPLLLGLAGGRELALFLQPPGFGKAPLFRGLAFLLALPGLGELALLLALAFLLGAAGFGQASFLGAAGFLGLARGLGTAFLLGLALGRELALLLGALAFFPLGGEPRLLGLALGLRPLLLLFLALLLLLLASLLLDLDGGGGRRRWRRRRRRRRGRRRLRSRRGRRRGGWCLCRRTR